MTGPRADAVTRVVVSGDGSDAAQMHGSTHVLVGDTRVVAWFAGTGEGFRDTAIWVARRIGDGPWEAPRPVLGEHDAQPWWNPVLAVSPGGVLTLFAHRGERISRWQTLVSTSEDGGGTWSVPRELVPGDRGGRGPVRTPPIRTPRGAWLAPSSCEGGGIPPVWEAFFDRSEDDGRTWTAAPVPLDRRRLHGPGAIQPALWFSGARAIAILRTGEGRALRTTSEDDGRSWSPARAIDLPQNNSGLAAAALSDGRAVLVHNPVGGDWADRCPLSISLSSDEGVTWTRVLDLDDGKTPPSVLAGTALPEPPAGAAPGVHATDLGIVTSGIGEYSYPTVLTETDGSLTVSYTWQRCGIVLAHVPASMLSAEG
jgi:predicted neuraminidase